MISRRGTVKARREGEAGRRGGKNGVGEGKGGERKGIIEVKINL